MSEFIPIAERLPDFDEVVLLATSNANIFIGGRTNDTDGWLWFNSYDTWYWDHKQRKYCDYDSQCDDDYEVTHWAPLPIPPAQGEQP